MMSDEMPFIVLLLLLALVLQTGRTGKILGNFCELFGKFFDDKVLIINKNMGKNIFRSFTAPGRLQTGID